MARKSTLRNRFDQPETGSGVGIWAAYGINGAISAIDQGLDGIATIAGSAPSVRVGAPDDLRCRVWRVVGDVRDIAVPDFEGTRLVVAPAAGFALRSARSVLALTAGATLVYMTDEILRRSSDGAGLATVVPTEDILVPGRLNFMSSIVDGTLPEPVAGEWIVVAAALGGSRITAPIQTTIESSALTTIGRTVTVGGSRIVVTTWPGDVSSVLIEGGRTARFIADPANARWIRC